MNRIKKLVADVAVLIVLLGLPAWSQIRYYKGLNLTARDLSRIAATPRSTASQAGQSQTGTFTTIDFPGSLDTTASYINPQGQIVGNYFDANGNFHGFLLSRGTFASIDFPGAAFTGVSADNARGDIVGSEEGSDGNTHGFLLRQGGFTTFDFPGVVESTSACFGAEAQMLPA